MRLRHFASMLRKRRTSSSCFKSVIAMVFSVNLTCYSDSILTLLALVSRMSFSASSGSRSTQFSLALTCFAFFYVKTNSDTTPRKTRGTRPDLAHFLRWTSHSLSAQRVNLLGLFHRRDSLLVSNVARERFVANLGICGVLR
jgi:hypothetical protein